MNIRGIAGALAAAGFLVTIHSARADDPAITPLLIYDLRIHGTGAKTATITSAGATVSVDVLAFVGGTDANFSNDAAAFSQFSLQTANGGLRADISLSLATPFNGDGLTNIPPATDYDGDGDKELGSGTGSTGANSDTIIANVGNNPINVAAAAKIGEESFVGITCSEYLLGTAAFTVDNQVLSDGLSTTLSFLPRFGGGVVLPQKFWTDGTFTPVTGNDARVMIGSPLTIVAQVPEPAMASIAVFALAGLGLRRRRS